MVLVLKEVLYMVQDRVNITRLAIYFEKCIQYRDSILVDGAHHEFL